MEVTRYVASALHLGGPTAALACLISDGKDLMPFDAVCVIFRKVDSYPLRRVAMGRNEHLVTDS